MTPPLGKAHIGLSTFLASSHPTDKCGTNGLPITPNSISIVGRFKELKTLTHPRLCQYIDIVRGKHERLVVVAEHYDDTLEKLVKSTHLSDFTTILRQLCYDLMVALDFLHFHGYVHRNLSMKNILLKDEQRVKLSNYGIYHMSCFNDYVAFPICDLLYTSPEVIAAGSGYNFATGPSLPSTDVWSLGMILLDCYTQGMLWGPLRHSPAKLTRFLINLATLKNNVKGVDEVVKISEIADIITNAPEDFIKFVSLCLTVDPMQRPPIRQLFVFDFVKELHNVHTYSVEKEFKFPAVYRSQHLTKVNFNKLIIEASGREEEDHLAGLPIHIVYHLWGLAGGDVFGEFKKRNLIHTNAPVLTLPLSHLNNGEEFGLENDESRFYNDTTVCVSLAQLRNRLEHINPTAYYPLVIEDDLYSVEMSETEKLPLVIREKNIEYQFHRVVLFERLLKGYPHSRERLIKEARVDIPPFVRARVWATLLNITGDIFSEYDRIDKVSDTATDRQIEVDIPRCHQYHHLLASPTAHKKLKRVLKTWVVTQDKYVYWQGLDSLCAPFVALNFNNEALAFACISAFIPKYLYNFFLKDNSPVIQEYLAVFSQLIAFHEPALFNHMSEIGFVPELYAIPWFLTMFSHVFPLHKIFHLWDTLLLGLSMLPLCVGVSLLMQFKEQLLTFGFNECILLFSDMPSIDIERCVKDSIKLFNHTPPSATMRRHDNPLNRSKAPSEEQFMNLPEKEFLPLTQLKSETCVRISARDLVRISSLTSQFDDAMPALQQKEQKKRANKSKKATDVKLSKVLTIDIREADEFEVAHFKHSINVPYSSVVSEEGTWISGPGSLVVEQHKGRMVLIMGPKGRQPIVFGQLLVAMGYRRVCVMDSSTNVLKSLGYFSTK